MNNNTLYPQYAYLDTEYFSSPIVVPDYNFLSDTNVQQDLVWPYYNDYSLDTQLSYQDAQFSYYEPQIVYCEAPMLNMPAIDSIPMSLPMKDVKRERVEESFPYTMPNTPNTHSSPIKKNMSCTKSTNNTKNDNKEKPLYQCDICKKSFERKYVLKRHIGSHFNIKTHHCKPCNISFYRKDIYDRHRTTKKCVKAHQLLPLHCTNYIQNINPSFSSSS